MLRFVVIEHDSPRGLHWDFMLETGLVLATWALRAPPDSSDPQVAERLPDHRLAYLEYEGPVSGDRGTVVRWAHGTYQVERQDEGTLSVILCSSRLEGRVLLERLAPETPRWRFSFARFPRAESSTPISP